MPNIIACVNGKNGKDGQTVSNGTSLIKARSSGIRHSSHVEHENFWAASSNRRKRRPTPKATVGSEADLDKLLSTHPTICALPSDEEKRVDLTQLAPRDKRYVYIMMDSGASLHAADLEKHFEGHELVVTEESIRGDVAYTANGDNIYNLGRLYAMALRSR